LLTTTFYKLLLIHGLDSSLLVKMLTCCVTLHEGEK
jgi:hypothetical protein